ncbi:hypothetical protein KKC56_02400 [Patescibacteria group bacterium]|nr:hypothetical protein [Patescibacteria group bacterium]MBU1987572.1 hypothetical protein [Patescibacteria group bacterium]
MENLQKHSENHMEKENSVESTLASFDRIVDWNSSLTSREDLEKLLHTEKQLRIKFGADITAQTLLISPVISPGYTEPVG